MDYCGGFKVSNLPEFIKNPIVKKLLEEYEKKEIRWANPRVSWRSFGLKNCKLTSKRQLLRSREEILYLSKSIIPGVETCTKTTVQIRFFRVFLLT
jgi:hypothetical protein